MNFHYVGKLISTHGLKGELKAISVSDFERFYPGSVLYILIDSDYLQVTVSSVREMGQFYLVAFEEFLDIDLAKKLTNKEVFVSDLEREPLEKDNYYYSDLIGLEIVNQSNQSRGIVAEVREVPQGHMLVVNNEKKAFIPFRKEFITNVDLENRIIFINEIEGLL